MGYIGEDLFHFQASLEQAGGNLQDFIRDHYVSKWISDTLYSAMAVRTTMVAAIHNFLADEGLFNLERVQMSPVTDPLAHDVEHTPTVNYKGMPYVTTHSMIYSKFLACYNTRIKGIFVDSPNIRLEIESPMRQQRGKYLIDFSQIDVELRRNRNIDFETYKHEPEKVRKILAEDFERALDFFERMIITAVTRIVEKNEDDLKALGVALEVPKQPFPRLRFDEIVKKFGKREAEAKAGETVSTPMPPPNVSGKRGLPSLSFMATAVRKGPYPSSAWILMRRPPSNTGLSLMMRLSMRRSMIGS